MAVDSYRDLHVWQAAVDLAVECYTVTRAWPREEIVGLTSQVRRAAGSVAANVAKGHGRFSTKEYLNFVGISRGSLRELETHLVIASRVGLLSPSDTERLLGLTDRVGRMITKLSQTLRDKVRSRKPGRRPE